MSSNSNIADEPTMGRDNVDDSTRDQSTAAAVTVDASSKPAESGLFHPAVVRLPPAEPSTTVNVSTEPSPPHEHQPTNDSSPSATDTMSFSGSSDPFATPPSAYNHLAEANTAQDRSEPAFSHHRIRPLNIRIAPTAAEQTRARSETPLPPIPEDEPLEIESTGNTPVASVPAGVVEQPLLTVRNVDPEPEQSSDGESDDTIVQGEDSLASELPQTPVHTDETDSLDTEEDYVDAEEGRIHQSVESGDDTDIDPAQHPVSDSRSHQHYDDPALHEAYMNLNLSLRQGRNKEAQFIHCAIQFALEELGLDSFQPIQPPSKDKFLGVANAFRSRFREVFWPYAAYQTKEQLEQLYIPIETFFERVLSLQGPRLEDSTKTLAELKAILLAPDNEWDPRHESQSVKEHEEQEEEQQHELIDRDPSPEPQPHGPNDTNDATTLQQLFATLNITSPSSASTDTPSHSTFQKAAVAALARTSAVVPGSPVIELDEAQITAAALDLVEHERQNWWPGEDEGAMAGHLEALVVYLAALARTDFGGG